MLTTTCVTIRLTGRVGGLTWRDGLCLRVTQPHINSIDEEAYQAAECADYERFHRDAYGPEDDMTSSRDAIYNDRLSMGRNDAGEWLGFM